MYCLYCYGSETATVEFNIRELADSILALRRLLDLCKF